MRMFPLRFTGDNTEDFMLDVATLETPSTAAKITLPNGLRLNYVETGPADGPVVLMLHGVTDSSFSFSRVMPLMPAHLRVIALDQRGHGDSDKPMSGYEMDDFAGDALAFLDALGISRATLVGHSLGTFVARRTAEHAPHRVERLVLVGTALSPRNGVISELVAATGTLTDPVDETFIRDFQLSTIERPVPPDFLDAAVRESQKLPARVWRAAMRGLWNYQPQWPITCPATILGGERDAVFAPEEQSLLFLSTEHSTLHLEPGVGHALIWEAPEVFVSVGFPRS